MDRSQTIVSGVLLLGVGLIAGMWLGSAYGPLPSGLLTLRDEAGGESEVGVEVPASGLILTGGNAVAVDDQPPGLTARVSLAVLADGGWVVVHEDADGRPGLILGARRLDAGEHRDVVVELLRSTEEGKVYYAMLHSDDGDKQFDFTKDLPITDPQGNIILMRFLATRAVPS